MKGQSYLSVCAPRMHVCFVVILRKPNKCSVVKTLVLVKPYIQVALMGPGIVKTGICTVIFDLIILSATSLF